MSQSRQPQVNLDALYDPPSETIVKGVMSRLLPFHIAYLDVATFFCLATGSAQGLDASPRGGEPGFVKVLDERTVAFADWPGNNRIASLRNLTEDDRVGMLFLFPGLEVFMRINGRARICVDADLLSKLGEGGGARRRRGLSSPSTKCCFTAARRSTARSCGNPSRNSSARPYRRWVR
ncbi:pyridoxamine 5'-phosphate oxidase family protein [Pandoraea nosoerga]|uniref:pyridoxamine 5'-phosphate oxidase family protein n=1 Tax=Pandoraea nosoerga TaxID=2508296 RepID=UPI003B8A7329